MSSHAAMERLADRGQRPAALVVRSTALSPIILRLFLPAPVFVPDWTQPACNARERASLTQVKASAAGQLDLDQGAPARRGLFTSQWPPLRSAKAVRLRMSNDPCREEHP